MRTLPQLAVSAKLLCLLMVVICGAVPSMVRSVRLYNQCSSSHVSVDASGRVLADDDKTDEKFRNLTIHSVGIGVMTIYAEEAKRYLCFNRNWKLIGSKRYKGPRCQFYEVMENGYNQYKSAANQSYFVGFNSKGRPLRAAGINPPRRTGGPPRRHKSRARSRAKCLNFIKRGSDFSIGAHHERLGNGAPGLLPPMSGGGHDGVLIAGGVRGIKGLTLREGGMAELLPYRDGSRVGGVAVTREPRLGKYGNPKTRHGGKRKWEVS
ncbi:uncharacterized protein ths [Hetaerina americana]|uniref:uncharacterized protein ths n=1 Tax=Hetaerina americana TaxID=62018 RepID=UPI003A7F2B13